MAGIAGLRGTGDWGTDERPKDFRGTILWMQPNGDAPIFALTSRAGKVTKTDPEFAWWAESQNMMRFNVSGAHASGATTITINSVDPTDTTMTVPWGLATHLKPGDVLLAEPATDNATFDQESLRVLQVLSSTQIVVERGAGGTTPASLIDNHKLLLMGSAYAEGTGEPQAVSRNPTKFYNYTQIFKDAYELTKTADVTEARTGDPWSNDKKRKTFDHASKIEFAIMFGRRYEGVGENGKPLRYMGGLRQQIPASRTTVGIANVDAFMAAVTPAFDFKVPGTDDSRVMFMGNTARLEISKMIRAVTGANISISPPFQKWGMNFERWETPLGSLMVKSHPLMSQHPLYKNSAFLLDFNVIKYVHLKGRDTDYKDDIQAKGEDVRRGLIQTECSLMVDAGGLTCAYLGAIVQA